MPSNSLTAKQVKDVGEGIGKDAMKTAAVWTLAGLMTQGGRAMIDAVTKALANQFNKKR